ncbi:transcription factor HES-1-A-like [Bufo gargarizans]|uniref:transcription factor HES-1-A-like n=1 Tax=Bufo gargarizans TaxID=30331 RepID=UPI001CF515D5|nr:transcription factor HES-1-A-like [Bufo gargarizans]
MSKPLTEKKRRARINNSLEQLKTLLEKHYSYNVRKRKLEKADILELTVKHIENLLSMRQEEMAPVDQEGIIEYKEGFKGCLNKLSFYLMRTKTSQEKLGLMLVDHLNVLDAQAYDGHIQNVQVPTSLTLPKKSIALHPSHYGVENSMSYLESRNIEREELSGNRTLNEEALIKGQQILTQGIHGTSSTSSSSCPNNLYPPNSCQQPTNACWRPW